jgi:hypothetical protein
MYVHVHYTIFYLHNTIQPTLIYVMTHLVGDNTGDFLQRHALIVHCSTNDAVRHEDRRVGFVVLYIVTREHGAQGEMRMNRNTGARKYVDVDVRGARSSFAWVVE